MKQQIVDYLKACYPALYLVSHEERRVERILAQAAKEAGRRVFHWSVTEGRIDVQSKKIEAIHEPVAILETLGSLPPKSLLLLKDYHLFLAPDHSYHASIVRRLKDAIRDAKERDLCLVILAARTALPPELSKIFVTVDVPLPDRAELADLLKAICQNNGFHPPTGALLNSIVDSARGLSEDEATDAFSLSLVQHNDIAAETIAREKARTIARNGILEIVTDTIPPEQIGGLANLKQDLLSKRNLFTQEAWEFGLTPPRGMLVVGQPGTGKSLTAKALKTIFGIPLLRLEAGRLFGTFIGESEGNWRTAFATAKASAPCILWIDEAEGLFNSGDRDGGTTQRVIKAILQDMQEDSTGIFYCFTANDIDRIPDPIIDRLETWSVDLPDDEERRAIWKIQIAKIRGAKGWNPEALTPETMEAIVERSMGFSGRQIERAWEKALEIAFNEHRGPTDKDIYAACEGMIPTSITMAEAIRERQERLKNRCRPAS